MKRVPFGVQLTAAFGIFFGTGLGFTQGQNFPYQRRIENGQLIFSNWALEPRAPYKITRLDSEGKPLYEAQAYGDSILVRNLSEWSKKESATIMDQAARARLKFELTDQRSDAKYDRETSDVYEAPNAEERIKAIQSHGKER